MSKKVELISVVVPTLNEESHLESTLAPILGNPRCEVIVSDGGSADGTCQAAQLLGCRVVTGARGRAAQQNLGAQSARGDVLLFLHADCRPSGDVFAQIDAALTDPCILCGAFRHRIDARGWRFRFIEMGDSARARFLGLPFGDQGIFVRREVFEKLGGFADVKLMEDVLLMRELRRVSRVALLPGPLVVSARRWQKHGVVRQTLRNWSLLLAEQLGVPPDRLAQFYPPHRS